jgi:hypothetical protein
MVIGNLWNMRNIPTDVVTIRILHNWLPSSQQMAEDDPDAPALGRSDLYQWKYEPELLYAFNRSHISINHYAATAAVVARGLPVVIKGKVDKNTVAQH